LASSKIDMHESDPLARQLDHFCAVVRREVPPRVTVRDAMRTLAVTLAVAEAAHTGLRVAIPS
jgi:predicted dehydrogenase